MKTLAGDLGWMTWGLWSMLVVGGSVGLLGLLPLVASGRMAAPEEMDAGTGFSLRMTCDGVATTTICSQELLVESLSPSPPIPRRRRPLQDLERIPEPPMPLPEPLPPLPPPEDLLDAEERPPVDQDVSGGDEIFTVTGFNVVGSTVFSEAELAAVTAPYTDRPLTFAELLDVRSAITQLYVDAGYITSGAIVPPQTFQDGGVVEIRVIEGRLEEIQVTGIRRLQPGYISSRIAVGTSAPLNVDRLLERLQLLQLDPLIESIAADLRAGIQPGINTLVITVVEAESFDAIYNFDNNRSPSVGTARHQFRLGRVIN